MLAVNPWDRDRIAEDNADAQRAVERAELHVAAEMGAPETPPAPSSALMPGERVTYRGVTVRCGRDHVLRAFRAGVLVATALDDATATSLVDHELEQCPTDEDEAVLVDFQSLAELCARRGLTADAVGAMVLVSDRAWRLVETDRHRFERLVRAAAVG